LSKIQGKDKGEICHELTLCHWRKNRWGKQVSGHTGHEKALRHRFMWCSL